MKAWKFIVPVVLGAAALGGFAYAVKQTNGGKGTPPVPVPTGNDVRVQIIPDRSGGYVGVVVVNGVAQDVTVGPMPTVAELEQQIATYMAGQDVAAFYTVDADADGKYYFDGWSRGTKVAAAQGPFASEAAANTAGSIWVASQGGAAVGGSGCPSCDEKKRRMAAARAGR